MAADSGQRASSAALCAALKGNTLPRLDVVLGVVIGCHGPEEDERRFAAAWRRLRLGDAEETRPDLRVVRGAVRAGRPATPG